ncbi:MAG: class I SAM-dependent methyltransferase [Fuerstiella sp.]|nr:class I SAM-dependent methyltransferase [Fuerstiella sp.]MCP4858644.1 class I SAM-dependent methyltransferase [Fuerstiella sp.]
MPTERNPHIEIDEFFDQWRLYDAVIRHNYMTHREIHAAIHGQLAKFDVSAGTLLDLGCGDASQIARSVQNTPITSYIGVDLSGDALSLARRNLEATDLEVQLHQRDLLTCLSGPDLPEIDVLVAGFALHHLSPGEKQQFFLNAHRHLRPGGLLLLYDMFRQPQESRDTFLTRYLDHCRAHWDRLSSAQIDQIAQHIMKFDFPETAETLQQLAEDHGFSTEQALLFSDDRHGLWRFTAVTEVSGVKAGQKADADER